MFKKIEVPIKDLFGIPAGGSLEKKVWSDPDMIHAIPAPRRHIFSRDMMRDLIAWHQFDVEPALIYGPTGCGKTSTPQQMANRLGIPVWDITCSEETELIEFFGHKVAAPDGSTTWMDGPLTKAARLGGWFLCNEMDRLRPGAAVGLNGVLEARAFTLSGNFGEVVVPHPDFRIICTANTNLAGEKMEVYNTANIQDKSVLERFGIIIEAKYPVEEEEIELLTDVFADITDDQLQYWFSEEGIKVTSAADENVVLEGEFVGRDDFIKGMVRLANMIRSQSLDGGNQQGNGLERTMSTRVLERWAIKCITFRKATEKNLSAMHYALERSLTNGCTSTTKIVIHNLVKTVFGVEKDLPAKTS